MSHFKFDERLALGAIMCGDILSCNCRTLFVNISYCFCFDCIHLQSGPQSRPEVVVFCSLIRELVGNEFFSFYDNMVIFVWFFSRLLQRVRLAHLRRNLQNMTSLVCHCAKCTHTQQTQYAPVRYDWLWLYMPLFCLLIQYRKLFWKVLKNFAKYREMLPKVLRNNLKIFKRKIRKFREYLRRISRNIS